MFEGPHLPAGTLAVEYTISRFKNRFSHDMSAQHKQQQAETFDIDVKVGQSKTLFFLELQLMMGPARASACCKVIAPNCMRSVVNSAA